jgi:hypothetical protein
MRRFMRLLALALLAVVVTGVEAADTPAAIPLAIEKNRFQPDVIRVKAGVPFVLVITNKDKTPEEFDMQTPRIEKVVRLRGCGLRGLPRCRERPALRQRSRYASSGGPIGGQCASPDATEAMNVS